MSAFRAYSQVMDSGLTQICLSGANGEIAILPAGGFNLYSAIYKGRQFMMPTDNVANPMATAGVPVLFPMPNRTRDCKYSFGGHDCFIQKNGEARFLHGLMIDEPFAATFGCDENSAWCEGKASITKASPFFAAYPFPCTLTVKYTLTDAGIQLDYTVKNDGTEPLPFGFAIHPYFNKMGQPEQITIQVPAPEYYEANECMPTGKLLPVKDETDIRTAKVVDSLWLDHVYSGMKTGAKAQIDYKALGVKIALDASAEFVNMVVYTPHNRPGFCLENQTNATDYLNLYAQGVETAHMNILAPGKEHKGWIRATIEG